MRILLFFALCLYLAPVSMAQFAKQEINISQFTGTEYIAGGDSFVYAIVNKNQYYTRYAERSFLYKLDYGLTILDSVELSGSFLGPNDFFYPSDIELDSAGNIYSLHLYYDFDTSNLCGVTSYVLVHNRGLSLIDSISLDVDTLTEEFIELLLYDQNILVSGGAAVCGIGLVRPALFNYDLTTRTGRLIRFDTLGRPNRNTTFQDAAHTNNGFIVRAEPPIKSTRNKSWGNVGIDSSFNLTTIGSFSEKNSPELRALRGTGTYVPVTKDSIYQLSVAWAWPQNKPPGAFNYQNFGFSLLDSAYNVTFIDTLPLCGFECDLDPYGLVQASWDAYDYRTTDSVLFVQMERYVSSDNYYLKDTVPFYIYNFNGRKGQMNWVRKIERNYTCGGHAVAALPGNRWAISFNEYNWDKYPGENLSVHIWILNGNGDIISQREFQKPLAQINLYPNPAEEIVNIELPARETQPDAASLNLVLFDLSGKEQMRKEFQNFNGQLDISGLSEGVYVLQLSENGLPVASAKLKVER